MVEDRLVKEHKRKDAVEILKLAGVLEDIDDDVAELCIKLMPKGKDTLISMADLMKGVQNIKYELKRVSLDELKALADRDYPNNASIRSFINDIICFPSPKNSHGGCSKEGGDEALESKQSKGKSKALPKPICYATGRHIDCMGHCNFYFYFSCKRNYKRGKVK